MSKRIPAEQRREEFIEAAARVIAQEGVERATTRRIAQEAGAPLAALHYCFHSKEELLEAVQEYLSRDFASRLPPLPPEVRGLEAAIAAHADRVWQRITEHPEEQVATFELLLRRYRQSQEDSESQAQANLEMYQAWFRSTSSIYARAAEEAGEPVPNNLLLITQLFIAGIDGLSMLYVASPELVQPQPMLDVLVRSIVAACRYDMSETGR
ncbi:TetR/AcrR family transcriptional regulator [Citricoccus sp.]|uniref:TetR/AcrR family transcriptional regulator n=1 Tax=Citricoccus sp. TaxID=1978372 RepID=UPI00261DBCB5|nr:helix-turn-helix domain-containing protein [Citricoccus sp.]HRO30702.1 helix-turn-helix domain-containing protein [Citricoccus sp.]HRO94383.1 helix-turn-helix domain-containing protein [Citricoccus sp.]